MDKKSIDKLFEGSDSFDLEGFVNLESFSKEKQREYKKAKKFLDNNYATDFKYNVDGGNGFYRNIKRFCDRFNRETKYNKAVETLKSWEDLDKFSESASSIRDLSEKYLFYYASAFNESKNKSNEAVEEMENSKKEYDENMKAYKEELKAAEDRDERGSEYDIGKVNAKMNYLKLDRNKEIKDSFAYLDAINQRKVLIEKKFYKTSLKHIKARSLVKNHKSSKERYLNYVLKNKKFFE